MNTDDQIKMDATTLEATQTPSWLYSMLTSKLFVFSYLFSIAWLIYAKKSIQPLIRKNEKDINRDKKYAAFQRLDLERLSNSWAIYFWLPTTFLRIVIGYIPFVILCVVTWMFSFFKSEDDTFEGFSFKIIRCLQVFAARVSFMVCGILRWETEYIEYDYKKYLGPDWKYDPNKKPTMIIGNHQSFLDNFVNMYYQSPTHVAKDSVKKIPFVGQCATMFGCLYLTRDNKQSKGSVFTQISDRQSLVEQGKFPPLIIFVEGGTSNGKYLLEFKKGGFFALKSVRPQVIKYVSHNFDYETCIMKIQSIAFFMCATSISLRKKVHVKRLPVFEPNDWFFENHQKEGEEKWQTYARVIRDIIAEVGNLEKSDLSIEDKFEYKRQLYPSNKAKQTD